MSDNDVSSAENKTKERIEQFGFDVLDRTLWTGYKSNKRVTVVPMTRGIYNKYQGWTIPAKENPEDEGYLVEYLDGGEPNHPDHECFISWSPKDVFDRNHSPMGRGETPYMVTLDESPFMKVEDNDVNQDAWHPFQLRLPTLARAMTLGQYRKEYNTPAQEDSDLMGFAVRYPGQIHLPPSFVEASNFVSNYHLIGSPTLYINLDPNEPDENSACEQIKKASVSGGYPLRDAIAGLAMVDEASFYPNGVPMTIYKSKPLANGMALGTIETLSGENGKLDFSDALRALKFGYRVQRSGWNGKDMWLSVSNLNTATVPADKFWSPHNSQYAAENGGSADVPPCITMKNAKGQIQMGWLPSQEDCFSSDWFVFEKQDEFSGTDDIASMTRALEGLKKPLTESFESSTEGVDIQADLAEVKRKRVDPSFTFTERYLKYRHYEIGNRLPYNFTGEDLLALLKEAFPEELKEQLYYAPGKNCYSIGLRREDRSVFIKDVDADTIRYNDSVDNEAVTHKKNPQFMTLLFVKFFEMLFPIGVNPLTTKMQGTSLFDFDRAAFGNGLVHLANFFNNDARAVHGEYREGLYRTQLKLMILLENLLNTHGADIGEHGEAMTSLTLPEALMFVDAGLTVRHKTWGPEDSICKMSREGGSDIYRAGEDLPWTVPNEEIFRQNWVLLYKED